MKSFIKSDFLSPRASGYITLVVLFLITHYIQLSPYFLFIMFTLAILISLFIYEYHYKVYRFFKSIPIEPSKIILGRYISSLIFMMILIFSQLVFMMNNSVQVQAELYYFYTWQDVIIVVCLGLILVSVIIPIIHLFKSIYTSIGLIAMLILYGGFLTVGALISSLTIDISTAFDKLNVEELPSTTEQLIAFDKLDAGFQIIVERYIPGQPYVTLILASIVLLVCSYLISVKLFDRKDLA